MPRIFDPKVFQLGYVGLGCTELERTTAHYMNSLGLSETAKGHDGEAYLSVGYEHHNIILKKTDRKSLLSLGYQLKPNVEAATFLKDLRDLGLRPETKSDSQPGIASLIRGRGRSRPCPSILFTYRLPRAWLQGRRRGSLAPRTCCGDQPRG